MRMMITFTCNNFETEVTKNNLYSADKGLILSYDKL